MIFRLSVAQKTCDGLDWKTLLWFDNDQECTLLGAVGINGRYQPLFG